jgi:signal transduction histidine kinase
MTRPLNILLLEDSPIDAELIEACLAEGNFDFKLIRVDTEKDFQDKIESNNFDLILADYSLPSFDGLSALKVVRATNPDLPFIFVSGAIGEELAIETLKSGATDYVLKQRLQRLVPAVERALREAREIKERKRIEAERDELLQREQQARTEAESANRAKDEFLAVLSHELRTPLTAILGWSRMLRSKTMDEKSMGYALEVIERNARIQTQLIEDILDISRIITGKLELEMNIIDLHSIIDAAIDIVKPLADAKHIQVIPQLDAPIGLVKGDPSRLQQVIWNLLSNAIKFTPRGGLVKLSLDQVNSHVQIQVIDTGQGIEKEFLPFVFDRFKQANSSSKRKHGGLGLGLAIVRHLVEMHNGSVHAESEGLDKGAVFTIKLPLAETRANLKDKQGDGKDFEASKESLIDEITRLDNLRVLIVEDDKDTRDFLIHALERAGAIVNAASSVEEALTAIAEFKPDVLVSDIEMPEKDGYDLIRNVRERELKKENRLPAAALTAYARSEDRMKALRAGFQTHIPKPVNVAELTAVIANLAITRIRN